MVFPPNRINLSVEYDNPPLIVFNLVSVFVDVYDVQFMPSFTLADACVALYAKYRVPCFITFTIVPVIFVVTVV